MKKYFIILFLLLASASYAQPPRIDSMFVDEAKSELQIHGDFGAIEGKVWVDSVEMNINSWKEGLLFVSIPRVGRGAAGEVIVGSKGYQSNKRNLTKWDYSCGQYRYEPHIDGSSSENISSNLSARVDIHSRLINSNFNTVDFQGVNYCITHEGYSLESTYYGNTHSSYTDSVPFGVHLDILLKKIIFDVHPYAVIGFSFNRNPFAPDLDSALNVIGGVALGGAQGGGPSGYANYSGRCYFLPSKNVMALLQKPLLLIPISGSVYISNNNTKLKWDSLSLMTSYHLQVSTDSLFHTRAVDTTTSSLNLLLPPLPGLTKYFWRVAGINSEGESRWSDIWNFASGTTTDVKAGSNAKLSLSSFPNPTSKVLTISYSLPESGNARINLYDLEGRIIRESKITEAIGEHQMRWNVSQLPSGSYVLGLVTENESKSEIIKIVH